MGDSFGKFKIDVEVNNSLLYLLSPTTPNTKILQIFNLITHKEDHVHILYGCVILKSEICHRKHMCSNICGHRRIFYVHPMRSKSQSGEALILVTRYIGVPNALILYNSGEHIGP